MEQAKHTVGKIARRRTRRVGLCLSVFAGAVLSGCVSSDQASRYYGQQRFPPRETDSVEVLRSPPAQSYDILADFQSRGESPRDMQRKAAEIGADAVIVVLGGGYRSRGDEWAGESSVGTYSRIMGTAIRYKEAKK